jgi:hypothetical protein
VQDDDDIWNYEYFLLESAQSQLVSNDTYNLQVPVQFNSNVWDLYKINSWLNTAEDDSEADGHYISAFIFLP